MSDWQIGDLAVCVDANGMAEYLTEGATYVVEAVWHDVVDIRDGSFGSCLELVGVPRWGGDCAYCCKRFRKVRPDAPEACESEFVTLLTRIKRKQGADA